MSEPGHRRVQGISRCDVDNPGASGSLHRLRRVARRETHAAQVDRKHAVEVTGRHARQRLIREDAGVIDEDLE